MIEMQINSIKLDIQLVFEFTENKGSADINSTPNGNRTPKAGKVSNISLLEFLIQIYSFVCHETIKSRNEALLAY